MAVYIVKRLFLGVLALLVILFASYWMMRLAPGDPAQSNLLSENSSGQIGNAEKGGFSGNLMIREKLYLDEPVWYGFFQWLRQIVFFGNWGESVAVDPGKPIWQLITQHLGITLKLNIISIVLIWLVSIPIGVGSAIRPGSGFDRCGNWILLGLYSLPVVWVALLVQILFCRGGVWAIFPLKGTAIANADGLTIWQLQVEQLKHYFLPVICLSYGGLAGLSRYVRSGMIETLQSDYIRTARAKGVFPFELVMGHGFKNCLIPLITLAGGMLPSLIAGSVMVEYVFNLPGMGMLALKSLSSRDYPLQMAIFFFGGMLTLFGILLADIGCMLVDPRIRIQEKH